MKYNLYFTAYDTEVIKADIKANHPAQITAEFALLTEAIKFAREYAFILNSQAPDLPIKFIAIHSELGTHYLSHTQENGYKLELDLIQNGPWYRDFEYIKAFYLNDEEMVMIMFEHREFLQKLSPEALENVESLLKERQEKQASIANTRKLLPEFTHWENQ